MRVALTILVTVGAAIAALSTPAWAQREQRFTCQEVREFVERHGREEAERIARQEHHATDQEIAAARRCLTPRRAGQQQRPMKR